MYEPHLQDVGPVEQRAQGDRRATGDRGPPDSSTLSAHSLGGGSDGLRWTDNTRWGVRVEAECAQVESTSRVDEYLDEL